MKLSDIERSLIEDVKQGVSETVNFIGELTEYHGEPVKTEYIITVNIARSLLQRFLGLVAIEYLINQIKGHALISDDSKEFLLGSQRFDVVVLDQISPLLIVEIKIKSNSLSKFKRDILKIMSYMEYLKHSHASKVLGLCVFQTEVYALSSQSLAQTTKRIHKVEAKIQKQLEAFSALHPSFEFEIVPFQGPSERIYDDEMIEDVDGTPMLGKRGYAARYHAVLIRRLAPTTQAPPRNWLAQIVDGAE